MFCFFVKDIFFRECSIKTSSHWGDSTGHWYFEEVLSNYGHCQMFEFLLSKYTINAVSMQLIILQLLRATEGTIWPKLTLLNLNSPNVCNVQGYPILSHSMFFPPQAMRLMFLIYFSVSVPWACLSTNLKTFSKLVKLFGRRVFHIILHLVVGHITNVFCCFC